MEPEVVSRPYNVADSGLLISKVDTGTMEHPVCNRLACQTGSDVGVAPSQRQDAPLAKNAA
jgi:hypothetical protein